jgi:hypothetical protein
MAGTSKASQLQIRVSEAEKTVIRRAADQAGLDMSVYVLRRLLPAPSLLLRQFVEALADPASVPFALAEINSLLGRLCAAELLEAVALPPSTVLSPFVANYVAAMIESACCKHQLSVPAWVRAIPPLAEPAFGSQLQAVRLYLLTHSPAAFRQRNIFVDTDVGSRV